MLTHWCRVSSHRNVLKHGSTDNRLPALQIFKEDSLLVPNVVFVTAHFVDFSRTQIDEWPIAVGHHCFNVARFHGHSPPAHTQDTCCSPPTCRTCRNLKQKFEQCTIGLISTTFITIRLLSCISWFLHVAANVCVPTDDNTDPAPEKTLAHLDANTVCHVKFLCQKSILCASKRTIAALDHLRGGEAILPLPHPASFSDVEITLRDLIEQSQDVDRVQHLWKKA